LRAKKPLKNWTKTDGEKKKTARPRCRAGKDKPVTGVLRKRVTGGERKPIRESSLQKHKKKERSLEGKAPRGRTLRKKKSLYKKMTIKKFGLLREVGHQGGDGKPPGGGGGGNDRRGRVDTKGTHIGGTKRRKRGGSSTGEGGGSTRGNRGESSIKVQGSWGKKGDGQSPSRVFSFLGMKNSA